MKRHSTIFLFLLLSFGARAGSDITTLDWAEMRIDSVLPVYSEVVPLESDFRLYTYSVAVEYPEWAPLTPAESEVVARYDSLIGEQLHIHSQVGVSRKVGMLDIAFYPIVRRGGQYLRLLSGKITITPVRVAAGVKAFAPASAAVADRYTRTSVLASGKWVKISIPSDGIYRLTRSALQRMGFSNPDRVHLYGHGGYRLSEVSNPEEEYDDLHEVPLYKADDNTWLFWGNGLVYWSGETRIFNPYATAACYFLTETETPNGITTLPAPEGTPDQTFTSFTDHVLYEKDEFAWFTSGRNLYENVNFATNNNRTYRLSAPNSLGNERLSIVFTAGNSTSTTMTPTVNGTSLSSLSMSALGDYTYATSASRTYDVAKYASGSDWTIRLSSTTGNNARLDYLALHYTRQLALQNGYVAFSQSGSGLSRFDITGTGLRALRIGTPTQAAALVEGMQSGSVYSLLVSDPTARYVAFDPTYAFPQPTLVGNVENQNLHALADLDMVIIVPQSGKLTVQAQRLADAHAQYSGLKTAVVRADQIYNEFSSGTPDATAYRRLMKMIYDRAEGSEKAPRYLLLMGDCAWDNRMLSTGWRNARPEDYLLSFQSENSFSDVKSYIMEDYFGLLDDGEGANLPSDKVDLGIGRFPVTTEAEAKVMVDKSIAFLTNAEAGNWKNIVTFMGDDGDNNVHLRYADQVAEEVIAANPDMEVRKVMWDAYTRVSTTTSNTFPAVTARLKEQMKEGALVMNYTGHAAAYSLSHERVLQTEDFAAFQSPRMPLWVGAACDVMPFDGLTANIGETAVLNPNGAAIGFFSTMRTVYAYNNLHMNRWFMRFLFDTDASGRRYSVGDAVRLAKTYLIEKRLELSNVENKLHYALLGDPALVYGAPANQVVLDSINGLPFASVKQLGAGKPVRLTGRVTNGAGELLPDFKGTLSARVYDSKEEITCLNNAQEKVTPFTFTDRSKVLFNGQDSVRAGRFDLSFVLPADINFSDESGRVVFYAITTDRKVEANGYSEAFTLGAVGDPMGENGGTDEEGPAIRAYLNSENFENGATVNATPYFVAHLEDQSGINYSNSSLGHDLMLTIDNNPNTTYTLNDYYTGEFGDYTRGTVAYSIPALTDGKHSLTFRAWDVLNNTRAVTLDFVVDGSQKPNLFSVAVSQNPAVTTTVFLVSHDRAGSACEVEVEVFDFTGRRLWREQTTDTGSSGLCTLPWNLSTASGARLGSGVYLYRVTLRSGDSKAVSKSQKIIIRSNN